MSFKYLKHLALTSTSWALSSSDDILVGGQAVVLGIRALRFSAEEALAEETHRKEAKEIKKEESTVSSWLIAGNLVVALGINILLFVALPLFLTRLLQNEIGFQSSILFNGIDGLIRVAVFVLFLYSVSWMKVMNRVFQYHGAEHKTVYNFEAREELNVENARRFSTLHPRCGTSFLLVVMVVSILVFSVVRFDGFTAKLLSRIVLLPLVAGISYEIIRYSKNTRAACCALLLSRDCCSRRLR